VEEVDENEVAGLELNIQGPELHRLIYNAILFSDVRSTAGGTIQLTVNGSLITVLATDDHVAVVDTAYITTADEPYEIHLSFDSAKQLEKSLRDEKGAVTVGGDDNSITVEELVLPAAKWSEQGYGKDFWGGVQVLTDLQDFSASDPFVAFALNPDRLRKFSLLKTPGKRSYPLDFITGYDEVLDREVMAFKLGPSCSGVLAPLLRSVLKLTYVDEPDVLW
jgi:hypothetical protein